MLPGTNVPPVALRKLSPYVSLAIEPGRCADTNRMAISSDVGYRSAAQVEGIFLVVQEVLLAIS